MELNLYSFHLKESNFENDENLNLQFLLKHYREIFNLATRYWLSFENRGVLVSIFGKEILEIIVLAGESKNFIYYHLKVSIILYKSTFK